MGECKYDTKSKFTRTAEVRKVESMEERVAKREKKISHYENYQVPQQVVAIIESNS